MGRTCGEPNEIKKNTHPKNITALYCGQARGGTLALLQAFALDVVPAPGT